MQHALRRIDSTGARGYPVGEAAQVAVGAVRSVLLASSPSHLVCFVLFSQTDFESYARALAALPD